MFTKKIVSALIAGLTAASLAACSQGQKTTPESVGETTARETAQSSEAYYAGTDLGGEVFGILNVAKNAVGMICAVTVDEQSGEIINDAIFNRNSYVMDRMNFKIAEDNRTTTADVIAVFKKAMLAGEDTYAAAYVPMNQSYSCIADGYFTNLNDVTSLNLSEDWWDKAFLDATEIGGRNYFASSPLQLMGLEGTWCLFFNEDMMADLGLEFPYELVREGKWTLAEFAKYCKTAANLNGADSFALKADSPCIYGSASFYNAINKFIYGMGGDFVVREGDDFVFSGGSEKFLSICQRLGAFFAEEGSFVYANDDNKPETSYTTMFTSGRALFLGAEVKMANTLRPLEESFGIVPFPKYDETQESYRSTPLQQVALLTIPITNTEPEKVGAALDALSYESLGRVLPLYYQVQVEQKGLRNEDSIEMLQIIKNSCSFDLGIQFGWVNDLDTALRNKLTAGDGDVASTIASYQSAIEANIANMVGLISK